jgi:hypothetical protein
MKTKKTSWKKVNKNDIKCDVGFGMLDEMSCKSKCKGFPNECQKECSVTPVKIKILKEYK